MIFMKDITHSYINNPIIVGITLMIEGLLLWIVPILVFNFWLNYGWGLLKNIFDISTMFIAIGMLIGLYSSKYLVNKDDKYVIFEKNNLEKFFKIILFLIPLVVIFSAIVIKYLIVFPMTYTQTESIILIFIISYGGGVCFSMGYRVLNIFIEKIW